MATIDELTQQVNTLTQIVNNITSNSVNISALTNQDPVQITSEIPASYSGSDVKISVQSLLDFINSNGVFGTSYSFKNANYTLTNLDGTIECTSNSFTISLPTSIGINGRIYIIKSTSDEVITVDGFGTETIDGELTQLLTNGDSLMIQSNGVNWVII